MSRPWTSARAQSSLAGPSAFAAALYRLVRLHPLEAAEHER
jgi:hypothetical protein